MTVAHVDHLVLGDEYEGRAALPPMSDEELHAFHQDAATIAYRNRDLFPGVSRTCPMFAVTPIARRGTLAGYMQEHARSDG